MKALRCLADNISDEAVGAAFRALGQMGHGER
jgi:hypothetical protein